MEWGEDDGVPPPGYEFTQALLGGLLEHPNVRSSYTRLPPDFWEHSNWYFSLSWGTHVYDFAVQAFFNEPPRWFVDIARSRGCLGMLINSPRRDAVDDEFLALTARVLTQISAAQDIRWIPRDEAAKDLWT